MVPASGMFRRFVIIQDVESGLFLFPHVDGDVRFTADISEAGLFDADTDDDLEGAFDTASMHCAEGFRSFSFYRFC